jgi:lysozyme
MNLSIEKQLSIDEGKELTIYFDTENYPTIGIGHLIKRQKISRDMAIKLLDSELGRSTKGTISDSECSLLFGYDLANVHRSIRHSSFYDSYMGLDPVRKSAIENMVFQMGATGVSQFKNMWAAIRAQEWGLAYGNGKDSRWYRQTKNRAERVLQTLRTGSTAHYPSR